MIANTEMLSAAILSIKKPISPMIQSIRTHLTPKSTIADSVLESKSDRCMQTPIFSAKSGGLINKMPENKVEMMRIAAKAIK
jgi:hypothetical protein